MSEDKYREVAPATDAIALNRRDVFQKLHTPGAVVVQADAGWGYISIMHNGSEIGVLMSRDELLRLSDLIDEAHSHLWREEREAADE